MSASHRPAACPGPSNSLTSASLAPGLGRGSGSVKTPACTAPPACVTKFIPIACLNTFVTKWTVRARVTNKSEVRTWSNSRGEGKLFSFEIMDESKEIRVTAFNKEVDTFFSLVEQGKVYLISKGTIKQVNKRFSTGKNDYEMTLNNITTILPCDDDCRDIPTLQCDFVPIADLENKDPDAIVDEIGVCRSAEEVSRITTKAGREVSKRELSLMDTGYGTTKSPQKPIPSTTSFHPSPQKRGPSTDFGEYDVLGSPPKHSPSTLESATPRPAACPGPSNSLTSASLAPGLGRGSGSVKTPACTAPPACVTKFIPIACLNTFVTKWTVRARVTKKDEVRTWSNSRGEGKLFSFEIMDESKEIRVTAFNKEVDTFFSLVEQGKVYLISNGTIKQVNKRFSTGKNDYEMTLNNITTILPCDDDCRDIPTLQCDFVPIADLENKDPDAIVDEIGVCRSAEEVSRITTKAGREVSKRELSLMDTGYGTTKSPQKPIPSTTSFHPSPQKRGPSTDFGEYDVLGSPPKHSPSTLESATPRPAACPGPSNSLTSASLAPGLGRGSGSVKTPACTAPPACVTKFIPIACLNTFVTKWTVRARVTKKDEVRTWSNSRGEGKLFSFEIMDESKEIRVTAFNKEVDTFFSLVEQGKVYLISNGTIKQVNKRFSTGKNDYEMTLNNITTILPCDDDCRDIPTLQCDFVPIADLENKDPDAIVDVIGVCRSAEEVSRIMTKTGREVSKRELSLMDASAREVRVTLWGEQAERFDGSAQPIVAVKAARLSEFGGRSLSATLSSTFMVNPNIPEAFRLRAWYDRVGQALSSQSLTQTWSSGGVAKVNWKTLSNVKNGPQGPGPQGRRPARRRAGRSPSTRPPTPATPP